MSKANVREYTESSHQKCGSLKRARPRAGRFHLWRRGCLELLVVGHAMGLAGAASAAETERKVPLLEEIVVIAQKREESLLEVPTSVQVAAGTDLERSALTRVDELGFVAPSLRRTASPGRGGEGLSIRGIGSAGFHGGVEQSVSVVIDGMVTGSSGSGLDEMWDVDRVEILRGPQGTLFGKNATAGVVHVISKRPTETFESELGLRYSPTYDDFRVELAISGPVTGSWQTRLSGFVRDQGDGDLSNAITGEDEGDNKRWGVRSSHDFDLGQVTAGISMSLRKDDDVCCSLTFADLDAETQYQSPLTQGLLVPTLDALNVTPGVDNRESIGSYVTTQNADVFHGVVTLSAPLGTNELRYTGGFRRWELESTQDGDRTPFDFHNLREERDLRVQSHEFQLVSGNSQAFSYILGAYYFKQEFSNDAVVFGGTDFGVPFGSSQSDYEIENTHYAVYFNGSYEFTERWSASFGIRPIYERIHADGYESGSYFLLPGGPFVPETGRSDSDWMGNIAVRWAPNEASSLWVSASRGYKGRAVDLAPGSAFFRSGDPSDSLVNPETVVSGEIGYRSYLNNRLSIDVVGFLSRYSDAQVTALEISSSGLPAFVLRNAAEIDIAGIELGLIFLPWSGGRALLNATLLDAEYNSFPNGTCSRRQQVDSGLGGTCVQDLSGASLTVPKVAYYAMFEQYFSVANDLAPYVRAEWHWRSKIEGRGGSDPFLVQDAEGLLNVRAGAEWRDRYSVDLFVRNALDSEQSLGRSDAAFFGGAYVALPAASRSWGVEVRARM